MEGSRSRSPNSEQLIRIHVDRDGDVFGEGQFVESVADKTAQAHDGFAADQNVETELALQFFERCGRCVAQDEFVGQWIALGPLLWLPRGWMWIFGGFILFRIFDIAKPWPVSWADRHVQGGFGVMLDDVVAGAYAALALTLLLRVF